MAQLLKNAGKFLLQRGEIPVVADDEIGARHADDAGRAHFYAIVEDVLEDPELPAPQLDWLAGAGPRMAKLFREGRMVR